MKIATVEAQMFSQMELLPSVEPSGIMSVSSPNSSLHAPPNIPQESRRPGGTATGRISELIAAAAFAAKGYEIAIPFGNQAHWDLLVSKDGPWQRVQVKTAYRNSDGAYTATFRKTVGRTNRRFVPYSAENVDLLVAVYPETNTVWALPVHDGQHTVTELLQASVFAPGSETNFPPRILALGPGGKGKKRKYRPRINSASRPRAEALDPNQKPQCIRDKTWSRFIVPYLHGRTYEQIAQQTGRPVRDVQSCVSSALRKISRMR